MSRTDVHAPFRVKTRDPSWRDHFTEHHNHTYAYTFDRAPDGTWQRVRRPVLACELGRYLAGDENAACTMWMAARRRNINCGCGLCTGHRSRRYARRQERTRWRQIRAGLLAAPSTHWEDLDVPLIRGSGKSW